MLQWGAKGRAALQLSSVTLALKRSSLVVLFASIVFVAYPSKRFDFVRVPLWRLLFWFGVDVAIEPFTSDMFFMYDPASGNRGYTSDYKLVVTVENQVEPLVLAKDLDFHHLRLPLLLMYDYEGSGADTSGFVYAICKNINHLYGVKAYNWSFTRSQPLASDPWMRAAEVQPCLVSS